jgi:hypothetical protein
MAKEQKHATLLCVVFSVWMALCVLVAALYALAAGGACRASAGGGSMRCTGLKELTHASRPSACC